MFQTINSFLMFFERQRPIKGLNGTVAFFAQLGNCNYSQWPQWFVTGLTVIPRAVAVKVIADLLRDQYPMGLILETKVRKAESLKIPHGGPYHDCGRQLNLPIVSFYNPVSEFTFIGPLFSATPAGWRLSSVCPAINQVPLLENRAVCTDRPRFDEPPKQTYSSLAQNPLQNFALLFKCITISDGLTAC